MNPIIVNNIIKTARQVDAQELAEAMRKDMKHQQMLGGKEPRTTYEELQQGVFELTNVLAEAVALVADSELLAKADEQAPELNRLMSIKQVVEYITEQKGHCNRTTLYNHMESGKLDYVMEGKKRKIRFKSILEYLKS